MNSEPLKYIIRMKRIRAEREKQKAVRNAAAKGRNNNRKTVTGFKVTNGTPGNLRTSTAPRRSLLTKTFQNSSSLNLNSLLSKLENKNTNKVFLLLSLARAMKNSPHNRLVHIPKSQVDQIMKFNRSFIPPENRNALNRLHIIKYIQNIPTNKLVRMMGNLNNFETKIFQNELSRRKLN
jgi:hypothetical protein